MIKSTNISRRIVLSGAVLTLGGCSAISALNESARPLDTYDLTPATGSTTGRRTSRTLIVARPEASTAIATDRIMIKPDSTSITYLPNARWSDELPVVVQSLLIRSISGTGRIGYVGRSEGGPIADKALLVRIDAFHVVALGAGGFDVRFDISLTLLSDRTQRVTATRSFAQSITTAEDTTSVLIAAFQSILDSQLPSIADWVVANT